MYKILSLILVFVLNEKPVKISDLMKNPEGYKNKEVLITGEITAVCQGSGCWIEVKEGDAKIIAKSLDHKVLFPKDCVGKKVKVRGILREKIQEPEECTAEEKKGEKSHECPKPEYFIEIKWAKILENNDK